MKVTLRRRAKSSWRQWAQPPRTPLVIFFYYLYDYIPNDWRIPLSPGTDVGRYRVYTAIPLEEEEEGFLFFFFIFSTFERVKEREQKRIKADLKENPVSFAANGLMPTTPNPPPHIHCQPKSRPWPSHPSLPRFRSLIHNCECQMNVNRISKRGGLVFLERGRGKNRSAPLVKRKILEMNLDYKLNRNWNTHWKKKLINPFIHAQRNWRKQTNKQTKNGWE